MLNSFIIFLLTLSNITQKFIDEGSIMETIRSLLTFSNSVEAKTIVTPLRTI